MSNIESIKFLNLHVNSSQEFKERIIPCHKIPTSLEKGDQVHGIQCYEAIQCKCRERNGKLVRSGVVGVAGPLASLHVPNAMP